MKIAISTNGQNGLESAIDSRFGRAAAFLVFDSEEKTWTVHQNTQNLQAAQGAGIQSAQLVHALGAEALITGHCGPKAFSVLQAADIPVYLKETGTVQEALAEFEAGQLQAESQSDVEGHW